MNIQNANPRDLKKIIKLVKTVFDIDHNPALLKQYLPTWLGHRIPGSFNIFEKMVCVVLGQLISTEQALQKLQKKVKNYIKATDRNISLVDELITMRRNEAKYE